MIVSRKMEKITSESFAKRVGFVFLPPLSEDSSRIDELFLALVLLIEMLLLLLLLLVVLFARFEAATAAAIAAAASFESCGVAFGFNVIPDDCGDPDGADGFDEAFGMTILARFRLNLWPPLLFWLLLELDD